MTQDTMTLKEKIINTYVAKSSARELNNVEKTNLLFDIVLAVITNNKWIYLPEGTGETTEFILSHDYSLPLEVNCFQLTNLFINLCNEIGFSNAEQFLYKHKPTSKIGQKLYESDAELDYTFQCFDPQFASVDNQICFDQHCVVSINDRYYDLIFSCTYAQCYTPYDAGPFAEVISAIDSKDEERALQILQTSNDINLEETFGGESLLHQAVRANFFHMASFLLENGINPNTPSKLEFPIIALAYVTDINSELFQLLARYTDPTLVESIKLNIEMQPFTDAVIIIQNKGSLKKFKEAMEKVDINSKDIIGWTLLHHAVHNNNPPIAEFLLKNGADPNIKDDGSFVPLHYASKIELRALLSKYTDPTIVEQIKLGSEIQQFIDGVTVIESNGSIKQFKEAIQGVDVNYKANSGRTLLHYAVLNNNLSIARFLLRNGANPNLEDNQSLVPLQYINETHSPMYQLLASKTAKTIVECAPDEIDFKNILPYIPPMKGTKLSLYIDSTVDEFSPPQNSTTTTTINISMQILGGFMAVVGSAMIATAFILLNAATFNLAGLALAGAGVAAILGGIGLFGIGRNNNTQDTLSSVLGVAANPSN